MADRWRLMAVHAHPDDESSKGAATMARYVAEGHEVLVVSCTGGERGDVLNPRLQDDAHILRDLAQVRRDEMARAQAILGVDHVCGPDGMALDADGNLYVAHFGSGAVFVFDRRGAPIDRLPVPGRCPTNVCFAGPDLDRLVVTLDDTGEVVVLGGVPRGRRLPFCPTATGDHPFAAHLPAPPTASGP